MKYVILFFLVCVAFTSCKKEETLTPCESGGNPAFNEQQDLVN